MVRLVQIEGLPVSQEFYSPNSAYVDVQLKYTGSPNNSSAATQEVSTNISPYRLQCFTDNEKGILKL